MVQLAAKRRWLRCGARLAELLLAQFEKCCVITCSPVFENSVDHEVFTAAVVLS
jgi:hypothetical protein